MRPLTMSGLVVCLCACVAPCAAAHAADEAHLLLPARVKVLVRGLASDRPGERVAALNAVLPTREDAEALFGDRGLEAWWQFERFNEDLRAKYRDRPHPIRDDFVVTSIDMRTDDRGLDLFHSAAELMPEATPIFRSEMRVANTLYNHRPMIYVNRRWVWIPDLHHLPRLLRRGIVEHLNLSDMLYGLLKVPGEFLSVGSEYSTIQLLERDGYNARHSLAHDLEMTRGEYEKMADRLAGVIEDRLAERGAWVVRGGRIARADEREREFHGTLIGGHEEPDIEFTVHLRMYPDGPFPKRSNERGKFTFTLHVTEFETDREAFYRAAIEAADARGDEKTAQAHRGRLTELLARPTAARARAAYHGEPAPAAE